MTGFHVDVLIGLASKISVILLLFESISFKKETNIKIYKKKTHYTQKIIKISSFKIFLFLNISIFFL